MTLPLRTILVAATGEEEPGPVAAAGDLAVRSGAGLHLVKVWGSSVDGGSVLDALGSLMEGLRRRGITASGAHLATGEPASAILATASDIEADLIVVGAGHRKPGPHGDHPVARAVVGHAGRPVLVTAGDAWPPGRVLISDDGSLEARGAAVVAAWIGGLYGAEGILVAAVPHLGDALGGRGLQGRFADRAVSEVAARLDEHAAELTPLLHSRPTRAITVDEAVRALTRFAGEAQLPVLVTLARHDFRRARDRLIGDPRRTGALPCSMLLFPSAPATTGGSRVVSLPGLGRPLRRHTGADVPPGVSGELDRRPRPEDTA